MSEHLHRLYSQWGNEKLVVEFNKKGDYSSGALAVMEKLIEERGLQHAVEALVEEERREIQQRVQEEVKKIEAQAHHYEKNLLGNTLTPKEYAQSVKTSEGVYYENAFGKKSGNAVIAGILLALGIAGLTIAIVFFFVDRHPSIPFVSLSVLAGLLLFVIGIYVYIKTKTVLRLVENKKGIFLEIEENQDVFCIPYPFSYEYFCGSMSYSVNHIPVNKNAVLHIVIHDAQHSRNFVLQEEVASLSQSAPPDWPASAYIPVALDQRTYANYIGKRSNLFKLKKILDGLKAS